MENKTFKRELIHFECRYNSSARMASTLPHELGSPLSLPALQDVLLQPEGVHPALELHVKVLEPANFKTLLLLPPAFRALRHRPCKICDRRLPRGLRTDLQKAEQTQPFDDQVECYRVTRLECSKGRY